MLNWRTKLAFEGLFADLIAQGEIDRNPKAHIDTIRTRALGLCPTGSLEALIVQHRLTIVPTDTVGSVLHRARDAAREARETGHTVDPITGQWKEN